MASNVNVAGDDDLRPQELRQSFVSRSEAVDAVQEFSRKQNKALQQNAIKSGGSVILLGCTDRLGKSNGTCPVSVRINKSTTGLGPSPRVIVTCCI